MASKKNFDEIKLLDALNYLYEKDEISEEDLKPFVGKENAPKIRKILCDAHVLDHSTNNKKTYRIMLKELYEFHDKLTNKLLIKEQIKIQEKQIEIQNSQNILLQDQNKIQNKQTKISNEMKWINLFIGILTIILISTQIPILVKQTNIFEMQLKLSEKVTSPFDPELKVSLKRSILWHKKTYDLIFQQQKLLNENNETEEVTICVKNMGQTGTGFIYATWNNNWMDKQYYKFQGSDSLKQGEVICQDMKIFAKSCKGEKNECFEDILPKGKTKLTLNVTCAFCETETIAIYDACIWNNSSSMCND